MTARYLIALFVFLSTCAVHAQEQRVIDSLKTVIQNAEHDTSVCDAYLSWGEQVYLGNPDTAVVLFHKARETAEIFLATAPPHSLEKKHLSNLASALNNIGFIHSSQGDISKAMEYFQKCLKIKEEIGDRISLAISLNNIGFIYDEQGDISTALEYYHRSLKIVEEMDNKSGIATSLNNIASIYSNQGDAEKAMEYFQKCLKIYEEIGDKTGISASLNNIGFIYGDQGDSPKGLEYMHKSLKIYEEIGDKSSIATSLNNIGVVYEDQGNITKALECYYKCLKINEEIGDKNGIAYALNNIGDTQFNQAITEATVNKPGALASALKNGKRALSLAREIGSPHLISANSGLLSKVAKQQALLTTRPSLRKVKYKEALEMYELHIQMRDSIKNEETQKATIRQQTKYEFEKIQMVKEQEEKELSRIQAEETKRRNNLQYSVIFIAILVLFGGVLALGFINVSERMVEGVIFFSFLILFEFLLVLADPYIDRWSGGAPGIKLLFNAGIAALIFPLHSLFERKLKGRLINQNT